MWISNYDIWAAIQHLRVELDQQRREIRSALADVAGDVRELQRKVDDMADQLKDEFEALATTWVAIKDEISKGLAKVEAALAAVDLSGEEAKAQALLADAQATLATVQASFAKLPELPVPPPVDPPPVDPVPEQSQRNRFH